MPAARNTTLLLVDDDDALRRLAVRVLTREGHTTLEARDADEAIATASDHDGQIDLLVTDVIMPRTSGRVLADTLLASHPAMKVMFVSGYHADAVRQYGVDADSERFLAKPVEYEELVRAVDEALAA